MVGFLRFRRYFCILSFKPSFLFKNNPFDKLFVITETKISMKTNSETTEKFNLKKKSLYFYEHKSSRPNIYIYLLFFILLLILASFNQQESKN